MARGNKIDHTTGEVKLVRGSGPPVLTIEGEVVGISDRLYVVTPSHYRQGPPKAGVVIGIDLTRRTVRLQIVGGQEVVYSADGGGRDGQFWLYSSADKARRQALVLCDECIRSAEREADRCLERLETSKRERSAVERWREPE